MEIKNKKECIVVIPVYSVMPTEDEMQSFANSIRILKRHDITLVTYKELNINIYQKVAEQENIKLLVEYFPEYYFKSVDSYNELCLSTMFYERFLSYTYMLICQLDVWIFRDELSEWCRKGYDYVGAPFFWSIQDNVFSFEMRGVGNGGFSLRKIQYCIDVLNLNPHKLSLPASFLAKQYSGYCKYSLRFKPWYMKLYAVCISILKICGFKNTLDYFMEPTRNYEDSIFGVLAKEIKKINANIPNCREAMKFSFEVHPEYLYKLNGEELPFGCHAYHKWDYESFWSKHIIYKNN